MAGSRRGVQDVELSLHETDVLLGLYSGCECLWNTKCSEYKIRAVRRGAFRSLVHGMRIETGKCFTVNQLIASVGKLKCAYKQELHRVLEGRAESGNGAHKSKWRWFSFLDSFLRHHALQQGTDPDDSCLTTAEPAQRSRRKRKRLISDDDGDGDENDDSTSEINSEKSGSNNPTTSRPVRLASKAIVDSKPKAQTLVPLLARCDQVAVRAGQSARERESAGDSSLVTKQLTDSLKAIQALLAASHTDRNKPSAVFARHIANELDQISNVQQRKQCMLHIQKVILAYQTGQPSTKGMKTERGEGRGDAGENSRAGDQDFHLQLDTESICL